MLISCFQCTVCAFMFDSASFGVSVLHKGFPVKSVLRREPRKRKESWNAEVCAAAGARRSKSRPQRNRDGIRNKKGRRRKIQEKEESKCSDESRPASGDITNLKITEIPAKSGQVNILLLVMSCSNKTLAVNLA